MTTFWTITLGLFVGIIAYALTQEKQPGAFLLNTIVGITGAVLGTAVGRTLHLFEAGGPGHLAMCIVGAIVLLVVFRYLAPSPSSARR